MASSIALSRKPGSTLSPHQRKVAGHLKRLKDFSFKEQWAVVVDRSPLIAVCGSRACAKTTAVAEKMIVKCLTKPRARCVYASFNLGDARQIFWAPVLLRMLDVAGLAEGSDYELKEGNTVVAFPNGAEIRLLGLDVNQFKGRQLRGQDRDVFCVDEAQDVIHVPLKDVVFKDVKPRMAKDGCIILVGTPKNLRRYFWQVTRDEVDEREAGWSVHRWTAFSNPGVDWKAVCAAEKKRNPSCYSDPGFRQEYLGEWTYDPELRCYPHFSIQNNVVSRLPPDARGGRRTLGADFGFNDAFCSTVWATSGGVYYNVACHKASKMSSRDVEVHLKEQILRWSIAPGDAVGDSASGGRSLIETVNSSYGLSMVPTGAKGDKAKFMQMLDADFAARKVMIVTDDADNHPLVQELLSLSWNERLKNDLDNPKLDVPGGSQDHACDAMLYAWRLYFCNQPRFAFGGGPGLAKAQPSGSSAGDEFFSHQVAVSGPSWRGVR